MVKTETVLIVHQDRRLLLGMQNPEKFGGGKWNGFGGKLKGNESIEEAAIREALEEGGIRPVSMKKVGNILFRFATDEPDHDVHFYKAESFEGELKESNEMIKYQWFHEDQLPVDEMWPADRHWLPYFVRGSFFQGHVDFAEDFSVAYHQINEVNRLE